VALAAFSLFVLLMAREAVAAIERLRDRPLRGIPRLLAYGILALSPPVWQSVLGYGHIEQPIEIWLVLVATRWLDRDRTLRAGAALALAVLARSSAVLFAAPFALASWRRGPHAARRLFAAAAATGIACLLPFFLADRADVTHSLFTYRGGLAVGAGSIWSVTRGSAFAAVVQHWDIVAVASAVIGANLWLATRRGGFDQARLFAGLTLTAASFALLAKTVWPYYFFEMFTFGTVWAFGRWKPADGLVRLALAPVAISTFGMVAEIGSVQDMPAVLVGIEGSAMFAMLGLTAAWILWIAGRSQRDWNGGRANNVPGTWS
jgi:hypothetical protein